MTLFDALINPIVDNVALKINSEESVQGCLCLSPNYLQFISQRKSFNDLQLLATAVSTVDVQKSNQSRGCIVLKTKDFRMICIEVSDLQMCQKLAESIRILSLPATLDSLPCFVYSEASPSHEPSMENSNFSACLARWGCPSDSWRVSCANEKYKLCPTYPSEVIVPSGVNEEILDRVSKYRYLNRFPILCYYHKKTSAPLLLSSQPMMGSAQRRCIEDSQMLNITLPYGTKGFVVDTRGQGLAQQQMTKGGGGIEVMECYPRWKVVFADLDSYQQLQTSLSKMIELCQNPAMSGSNSWFGKLDNSGWLRNIQLLLGNARVVISYLSKGLPVLVHGDTGYDAELQLVSLVQVILDPHCRTVRGFAELIERQWLKCGHPFSLRHRHCAAAPARESGPVLLAFLDAVYQIQCQFPTSFEFNERLLHFVFIHSYSSEYGTFLYDCQRERCHSKQYKKTKSLWRHLFSEEVLPSLLNPLYVRNKHQLHISVLPQDLVFWSKCYLRKDVFANSITKPAIDKVFQMTTENTSILQRIRHLYRIIGALEESFSITEDTSTTKANLKSGDVLPGDEQHSNGIPETGNPSKKEGVSATSEVPNSDETMATNSPESNNTATCNEGNSDTDTDVYESGYVTITQPVTKETVSDDFVFIDTAVICSDDP